MADNHKDDGVDGRGQNGRLAGHEETLGAGGNREQNAGRKNEEQKAADEKVVHFYLGAV
jgi:hypothetical protein